MKILYGIILLGEIMKIIIIKENEANQRIDKYLKKLLCNASTSFIYKMLRKKDIKVNGKKVDQNYILQADDKISMFLYDDKYDELTGTKEVLNLKITFEVVYEDDFILIVNKPAGLLVQGDKNENHNTLSNQVLTYLNQNGTFENTKDDTFIPSPVHRLDRNTSGLVIFAKTFSAAQALNQMIKERTYIKKSYLTICKGYLDKECTLEGYVKKLPDEARIIFTSKDDKDALYMKTLVKPVNYNGNYSEVEVTLVTGRMHQIRVHLSSIKHPIIGDRKYGDFEDNKKIKRMFGLNNQLLHAYKIEFNSAIKPLEYLNGKVITCKPGSMYQDVKKKLI